MGERCMKDTVHPPVPFGSPSGSHKCHNNIALQIERHALWARAKHRTGLERPRFGRFSASKESAGSFQPSVLPVAVSAYRSKRCRGPSSRSEDGKQCLLHPWSFHVFTFGSNIDRILKEFPRLHVRNSARAKPSNRAGATPDFRLSAVQKVFGVAPARCWFAVRAFFSKCETASLLADRISVWDELGFTQTFTFATSPHPAGVTACVRPRERALSNKPYAAPHTPCLTRSLNERRRVLATLKGTT